ncbi:MAG: hypothetical protein JXQ65_15155 [Candidatus Marinimicrobia bacterium]|nr:hypothetical protein [Candidatus Neomarinimicrobiota bacterium]
MEKVREIVTKIIEEKGLELVDFHMNQNKQRSSLRLLVDTPEGNVNLDQISEITSRINNNEEFEAQFPLDFRLEVSSPGLDYPMKHYKDFRRQLNRNIKVKYQEEDATFTLSGTLTEVNEQQIKLSGNFGEKIIPMDRIVQGKVEIKFK